MNRSYLYGCVKNKVVYTDSVSKGRCNRVAHLLFAEDDPEPIYHSNKNLVMLPFLDFNAT